LGGIYFQTLLGASGAIYGVVVAFAFLFPNTELMLMFIPYPIKAKYLVPGLIALMGGSPVTDVKGAAIMETIN
jgi:membrane associated rhomboid family serine protease